MKANVNVYGITIQNATMSKIDEYIVAFDIPNEDMGEELLQTLVDNNTSIGFYTRDVHVVIKRKEVKSIEWIEL